MAAGDIKAGRAYVELMLNDSKFIKGLRKASQRLKDFGTGIAKIGAGVAAAGAAITGPLTAAVNQFAAAGDTLDKMAQRTGIAAGALAELGFAAEQSGTNLDAVEASIKGMQMRLVEAANGSQEARAHFERLGLSVEQLMKLSPEQQFTQISEAIAAIDDPTKRAAAAMKIFEETGLKLLPMLGSMRELRKEAQELGLAPSDDAVKAAANVTDAFNRIRRAVGAVVFEIGYSLSDVVLEAADAIKNIVVTAGRWVKENRQLITTIFAIGVGLTAAGTAIVGIGTTIFMAGIALSGFASLLGVVGTALGFLVSPIGLVTAAVAGGVTAWVRYTESGQKAVQAVTGFLRPLLETVRNTFGGIYDAIASGNLSMAGEIAMQGLKVAFLRGTSGLVDIFGDFAGKLVTQIASGDISGAWHSVVLEMTATWVEFSEGVVAVFTEAARKVIDAWEAASRKIGNTLLEHSAQGGLLGKAASWVIGEDLQAIQRERDRLNREMGLPGESVLSQAKGVFNSGITSQFDAGRDFLDRMNREANANTRAAQGANRANVTGGTSGNAAALTAAQAELNRLIEDARKARETARQQSESDRQQFAGVETDPGQMRQGIVGSFSAAALSAMGAGGSPAERTAKATEKAATEIQRSREEIQELRRIDERLLQEVRMGGMIA